MVMRKRPAESCTGTLSSVIHSVFVIKRGTTSWAMVIQIQTGTNKPRFLFCTVCNTKIQKRTDALYKFPALLHGCFTFIVLCVAAMYDGKFGGRSIFLRSLKIATLPWLCVTLSYVCPFYVMWTFVYLYVMEEIGTAGEVWWRCQLA